MDSQEILGLALHLANQSEVPADTTINVPARDVRKVLFGIDVDAADLLFAKEKGTISSSPTIRREEARSSACPKSLRSTRPS